MILNVNVSVITINVFIIEKKGMAMKTTFLLLNNVISILDLFKTLTYYIEDKKILEIRNKKINKDNIFQSFAE